MNPSAKDNQQIFSAGILTISDSGSAGDRVDISGERIVEIIEVAGFNKRLKDIVPDEIPVISEKLVEWSDSGEVDIIRLCVKIIGIACGVRQDNFFKLNLASSVKIWCI